MKNRLFVFVFLLAVSTATAQGWERVYSVGAAPPGTFSPRALVPTGDGGFLIMTQMKDPHKQVFAFIQLAPDGTVLWSHDQMATLGIEDCFAIPVENGNLLFLGKDAFSNAFLVKTTSSLDIIWSKMLAPSSAGDVYLIKAKMVFGDYLITYLTTTSNGQDWHCLRTNSSGETVLEFSRNAVLVHYNVQSWTDINADIQGNIYVSVKENGFSFSVLIKFSPGGELLYKRTYSIPYDGGINTLVVQDNNQLVAAVWNYVLVLDSMGTVIKSIPKSCDALRPDGSGYFVGCVASGEVEVSKFGLDGTNLWKKSHQLTPVYKFLYSFWVLPDGGSVGFGTYNTNSSLFVFRADSAGNTFTDQVAGKLFVDLNGDCVFNTGTDLPAPDKIITATRDGDVWYTNSNTQGDYSLFLDSGTYALHLTAPNPLWEQCSDAVLVTLSGNYDTVQVDIGITPVVYCPWPEVTIAADRLRRCMPNDYTITYGNSGTQQADSAVITLELDPFLVFQSSSVPVSSVSGNVITFFLGDLAPLERGSFHVTVTVDCDAPLGQTHCSTATIGIANPCPTSGIEQPVIQVEGVCEGDSVAFTIRNIGGAPMPGEAEFIVIEDLIVMKQGSFQLNVQEDTILKCPSDGSTFRMYAGYSAGEPPFFSPTAAIQGCNGPIPPGFWNMFPEILPADTDHHCRPNTDSFDPNTKEAFPSGYDTMHFIERGIDLDYQIHFQNMGTDTALTVVIRDTLSPWLDPASIRIAQSSHPFTWKITGPGILEFRFDGINLPDSATNFDASMGYVYFHIAQKTELPYETLIQNRAAIFFDANTPVLTNTTWHRIGHDFLQVYTGPPPTPEMVLNIYPNPGFGQATIVLNGMPPKTQAELQLSNVFGQVVYRVSSVDGRWEFERGALRAGAYVLHIRSGGRLLGVGKLLVVD